MLRALKMQMYLSLPCPKDWVVRPRTSAWLEEVVQAAVVATMASQGTRTREGSEA